MAFINKSSGLTAEIRVKRCYGCGAILQDINPDDVGYLPKEKFENDEDCLCERCYKLRHYSTMKNTNELNIDYVTVLDQAKDEDALFVYVLNAFTLESSIIKGLGKYLSKKVLVIVNKRDILPRNYNDEYLLNNVKYLLDKENIKPLNILICSATNDVKNLQQVIDNINNLRDGKNVYFIGTYQVGKSSLVNSILMNYTNKTDKTITTSPYPGTTLDVITIPLDENTSLFDTPGISNDGSIISHIAKDQVKRITPRNEIKPESFQAKEGQSFFLANFARVDFVNGNNTIFTFFKSNDITIERAKINKADEYFNNICENKDLDLRNDRVSSIADMKKVTLDVIPNETNRVRIYGLAYFDFDGDSQTIEVYVPKDVCVTVSKASISL